MIKISNPFLVYGYINPDYFCDRISETDRLISALKNGRNVTLMSQRRMGKTGLIKNAFYHIQENDKDAACIYMDIFSTNNLSEFVGVFGKSVLERLDTTSQKAVTTLKEFLKSCRLILSANELTGSPQLKLDFQPSDTQSTLEEISAYLSHSDKECFIAIDEFQQITEYPEKGVEGLLRSLIQFCPNVHFIFSGSKRHLMSDIFNSAKRPFYRSTETLSLTEIPFDSYYHFAKKWMDEAGIGLSETAFQNLYEQVNGHTWHVQYMLNKLYSWTPKEIDEDLIRQCFDEIILSELDKFQQLYDTLSENQSLLLRAIAKEKCVNAINASGFIKKYNLKTASSVNTALKHLIDKDFVNKTKDGYTVSDHFMRLWLQTLP